MKITHTDCCLERRAEEYPPIEDYADAMYWHSKGDATKLNEYFAKCAAVKQKFPKKKLP